MAEVCPLPDDRLGSSVSLVLLTDVPSGDALLTYARGDSHVVSCVHTFVNPKMVCSKEHVLAAVMRALQKRHEGSMKTRSVASEILYSLSSSAHITDSLRLFGVSEQSSHVLLLMLDASPDDVEKVCAFVGGVPKPLSALHELSDVEAIRKHAKVGPLEEQLPGGLTAALVSRAAVKDV